MKTLMAVAAGLFALVAAAPVASAVVVNGSFESPDLGTGALAFAYRPNADFTGNAGVAANGSQFNFALAPDGKQVGFVQTGTTAAAISLDVINLLPGASYTFSFMTGQRSPTQAYPVNPFTVDFNGVSLGSFSPTGTVFTTFTTGPLVVGAATGTLRFTGSVTTADSASGIDLVRANLVAGPPGGAIPEPATWAMMIGGLGLVGGALRRLRTRRAAA